MNNSLFTPIKYPKNLSRFNATDLEEFIIWCVEQNTTDITIQNEEPIICEIYGKKHKVINRNLTKTELTTIIMEIYKGDGVIARLNSGKDVDMAWTIKVNRNKILRFRINMKPAYINNDRGYSITIRIVKNLPIPFLELDLPQQMINHIAPIEGFIIVTGGVGSGKSTLLASTLIWRMENPDAHLKIATYEKPIEYIYEDIVKPTSTICQSEIGIDFDTFEEGIHNALRSSIDVVLIGEMRDKLTINAGINAAMTGAQVYSTLHSNGVADTISRIASFFNYEERESRMTDLLNSLKMIVSQKLIPSTDGKLVAIREYLVFDKSIIHILMEKDFNKITHETQKLLEKYGQTFLQDLENKFKKGLIDNKTYQEIKHSLS